LIEPRKPLDAYISARFGIPLVVLEMDRPHLAVRRSWRGHRLLGATGSAAARIPKQKPFRFVWFAFFVV
jgi:hypothetical protein